MSNVDYSRNNGPDTITVSANSPISDLCEAITDAYKEDGLRVLHELRGVMDEMIGYEVEKRRKAGDSWEQIGNMLDVSRQAAQQRYGD